MAGTYRKRPVTIEAIQRTGLNDTEIVTWAYGGWDKSKMWQHADGSLIIPTLEGDHKALVGDWIIKGVQGEFYPCKPDIFAMTYEAALPPEEEATP